MAAKTNYTLMQKMQNLQSSFNLQINYFTQNKAQLLLTKLTLEHDCKEYDHPEEEKRYYNLITYLNYILRNVEVAKQVNKMTLEKYPESIVAHGNQAWILFLEHNLSEEFAIIEQILKTVSELCTDRVKIAVAKSEMAYSYARIGMLYYAKAESTYEEVLNDIHREDKLPVFLWQYGCGLIKNRLLRQEAIRSDTKYKETIKCAELLLSEVAKQDNNVRFKARACAELGNLAVLVKTSGKNMESCFPMEPANEMFLKAMNILKDNKILDIPVLEQYANHCRIQDQTDLSKYILTKTIEVKKSSRAYSLLAWILKKQMIKKLKGKRIPDDSESRQILKLYDSAIETQNITTLGYKGQFLMQMGKNSEAIEIFENVYRSLQMGESQQEELAWKTMVLCQTCHAKCLLRSPRGPQTIKQAKELLWSAIELCLDEETERHEHNRSLKHPVNAMLKLLRQGTRTPETMLEKIIMCELVGEKAQAEELRKEIEKNDTITVQQPELVRRLITSNQFNEGLFYLKQMIVTNTLPGEMKYFAIEAHIKGAKNALEKRDVILSKRRSLFAFDIRFPNDNRSITRERLHIFFIANECKQNLVQSMQECFANWTSLSTTSCFEGIPGRLTFSNLEETMHQSSVLAIVLDEDDMKKDDYDSRLFQISVEIAQLVQMTHGKEKALIVIADQSMIPTRLRGVTPGNNDAYLPR
ncbi:hypothetical protein CHS0354_035481 [Potamilus streckersoni]|uniref:Uncharacterized protein n=1 Tax=Potamilus streckersoni TaxID=2493646 RepID=A0AAE0VJB4_9BIVA|nr:hypothetical protein CHS0354_035481 [Potamilus streckersoni]